MRYSTRLVSSSAAGFPSGELPVRIPVDVRRFPWIKRLAADYAHHFEPLAPFYAGNPATYDAWRETVARTQAFARDRARMVDVIAAQQQRRGAPPRAVEARGRLADSRAVAVVTGQQAGLFGGPLFVLFKALTAVKLADEVARTQKIPVVPVFWVEGEDHDWDEVRSCTVFDADLTVKSVSLPPRNADDTSPVAATRLDTSITEAIDELQQVLPATEFTPALVEGLRAVYAPGIGMADAFARWLERTLGERGLVVYDASDHAAKPLVGQVFSRELAAPGRTSKLAGAAGASLSSLGYHTQVQTSDEGLALFHVDQGRHPLRQQDGHFVAGDRQFAAAAIVAEASTKPAAFSPNVLLRPIVQDTLFPTICYVAGPSELAYLGQLREVYAQFGVPMPLMYPRATATLIDSAALRFLTKYRVPLEALQRQDDASLNDLLKAQMPEEVDASFDAAGGALDAAMARVTSAMPLVDPTLEGAAKSTLGRMQHDLQTLRNKTLQAAKRRDETLRRQFGRARSLAFPNGHPQEREIGFVSFLNQYGPALVDRLDDELPVDMGQHWIISI